MSYGPIFEEAEWRRSHVRELRELYRDLDVVCEFECRRIRQAEHLPV
jgi:hypothetical protein